MVKYFGYALLLIAFITLVVWAFSQFFQPILPAGINSGLILLFAALLSVAGFLAGFRDTVELFQLLLSKPEQQKIESLTTLLRNASPDTLLEGLGHGGKVPWVDRQVSNVSLLMRERRVAIVGSPGAGKTREAAELLLRAIEEGLLAPQSIYTLGPEYHYTEMRALRKMHPLLVPHEAALLFIDDFPRRFPEKHDLEKLSVFLEAFKHGKTPYAIFVAREDQLTDLHSDWLRDNKFHELSIESMDEEAACNLVDNAAFTQGLALSDDIKSSLAVKTHGLPASIVLCIQRIKAHQEARVSESAAENIAVGSVSDNWALARSDIVGSIPISNQIFVSLGTFYSAESKAYTNLVHAYAAFLWYQSGGKRQQWRKEYRKLVEYLSKYFDIDLSNPVANFPYYVAESEQIAPNNARATLAEFLSNHEWWPSHEKLLGIGDTSAARMMVLTSLAAQETGFNKAEALFEEALRCSASAEAYLSRGWFYWQHNHQDQAVGDLEKARELSRNLPLITTLIYAMHLEMKDYESALIDIDLLSDSPIDPRFLVLERAKVLAHLDEKEAARQIIDQVRIDDNEILLIGQRLEANLLVQNYSAAIRDATLHLEFLKQLPDSPKSIEATLLTDRAGYYFNLYENDDALDDVERALELYPDNAKALALRSMVYTRKEELDRALADAGLAMKLDLSWGNQAKEYLASSAGYMGTSYANDCDYDAALRNLNMTLKLRPNDSYHLAIRGQVYRQLGEIELAFEDLTRAIEIDPDRRKAYHQRGLVYMTMGEYQAAIEDFKRAGLPYHSYYQAGLAFIYAGQLEQGLKSFREGVSSVEENSIDIDGPSDYTLLILGVHYAALDQFDMAKGLIKKALEKQKKMSKASDIQKDGLETALEYLDELKLALPERIDGIDVLKKILET